MGFEMDSGIIKRWKTLESLSVEDYFDDVTQIQRWSSSGKLNERTANFGTKRKVSQLPGVTCSVCNQRYNRPKLLPCLHSFCQSCIESLVKLSEGENKLEIACPTCSTQNDIPKLVESLPTNFILLQTLAEMEALEEKEKPIVICANCDDASRATGVCVQCAEFLCEKCTSAHHRVRLTRDHCITLLASQSRPIPTEEQRNNTFQDLTKCKNHSREELAYFCKTCRRFICRECTVHDHDKTSHDFEPLQETSEARKETMAALLSQARVRLPFMRRTLLEIEHSARDIPKHVDAIAEEIQSSTLRYVRALREREFQLLDDLDALREYKTTVLSEQKERLMRRVESLESACTFTQRLLSEDDSLHVTVASDYAVERLSQLNSDSIEIQPAEGPEIEYVAQEDMIFEIMNNAGSVENGASFFRVRVLGEGLFEAAVGKASTFTLAMSDEVSLQDLDVRIETPDGVLLSCDLNQLSSGIARVSYTPKIHGEHEISIQAQGDHVEGSPYAVHVKKGHMSYSKNSPVCLRFGNKGTGLGETECPTDVAVRSNGSIVVADTGNHRIQLFDGRGGILHEFGSHGNEPGKFQSPAGICVDQRGNIVVSDRMSNRVQIFNVDGVLLRHFGTKSDKGGELKGPLGVTVDEEGQILVADQSKHRVVIFNERGSFVQEFGCLGTKDGEFNNPSFIAVNQDGEIYVTDTCNHRVQIFDMSGKYVGKFGRPGTGNGEFQYPTGIAIDASGYVFISDRTNRVQVFNHHFRYVCKFGGKQSGDGQLNSPSGIDYTPEGRVAVADTSNNCVKVFYFPKDQS